MTTTASNQIRAFDIEPADPAEPWVTQLWHTLQAPICASERQATYLVARERTTGQVLGLAQYFRTFPPEDGCSAVVTVPEASHAGVGEALFRELAHRARHDGMRTLGTMVPDRDRQTLDALRGTNLGLQFSRVSGGLYVEIDLLTTARDH